MGLGFTRPFFVINTSLVKQWESWSAVKAGRCSKEELRMGPVSTGPFYLTILGPGWYVA